MALHPTSRHWRRTKLISDDQVKNHLHNALRRTGIATLSTGLGLVIIAVPAAGLDGPTEDSSPAPQAEVSASSNSVLAVARQYVGVPYVWGGSTPAGFDCSGFTMHVFAQVGISLPRTSAQQRHAGYVVSAAEARPGDLVWWPGHVGIYTGDGQHIAARSPGTLLYEGPILRASPTFIRVW